MVKLILITNDNGGRMEHDIAPHTAPISFHFGAHAGRFVICPPPPPPNDTDPAHALHPPDTGNHLQLRDGYNRLAFDIPISHLAGDIFFDATALPVVLVHPFGSSASQQLTLANTAPAADGHKNGKKKHHHRKRHHRHHHHDKNAENDEGAADEEEEEPAAEDKPKPKRIRKPAAPKPVVSVPVAVASSDPAIGPPGIGRKRPLVVDPEAAAAEEPPTKMQRGEETPLETPRERRNRLNRESAARKRADKAATAAAGGITPPPPSPRVAPVIIAPSAYAPKEPPPLDPDLIKFATKFGAYESHESQDGDEEEDEEEEEEEESESSESDEDEEAAEPIYA